MNVSYYVYYRLHSADHAAFTAALTAMQSALHAATGVAGRHLRRVDDPLTWMEIYENVADPRTFEVELGLHALRHGLNEFLSPGTVRHLERFRTV